ncbi:LamG-like jellyroll fold domain-containing protein [Planctomicrobium sp. SH527]|uniref:LamG domain-containing protein n=1 Tax=Planctomicrobium sp. SH527 TaxID=3448123 RepID=UPI003F5AEA07
MTMKYCSFAAVALALVASPGTWTHANAAEPAERQARVLIIGIDGTRPDALEKANTPNLDRLIQEGAFTDSAQIFGTRYQKNDSISGPGWSSILTGVWADKHGVHDNSFKGRNYELFPHFFKHLKQVRPDATTVSLVSWSPIAQYIVSEADRSDDLPIPQVKGQIADLRVSAEKLGINTRDGEWHHLVGTRTDGVLRLYLDGKLAGQLNSAGDQFDLEGESLFLGRDTRSGAVTLKGELDDVRLWGRALSADEISELSKVNSTASSALNKQDLVAEFLFDAPTTGDKQATTASLRNTASAAGVRSGVPVAKTTTVHAGNDFRGNAASRSLALPEKSAKEDGVKLSNTGALQKIPQKDFSFEVRFKTTDPGRNVLLGNYAKGVGAVNLELHESNSVRFYVQPANQEPAVNGLAREDLRDQEMARIAAKVLKEDNPDAMFIYMHQVDSTGHTIGFSPDVPEYVKSIENVDSHIGVVLNALRSRPNYSTENWIVIVCTDHGGIQKTHSNGHEIPEIRRVFLIVSGQGAEKGRIKEQAYLVDVAATALAHLTGTADDRLQLDGKPVGLKAVPAN